MEWEKWIAEQSEEVQSAYAAQVASLQSALNKERDAAKALKGQVKELTDKAATGDQSKLLADLQAKVSEMETSATTSAQALADAQAKLRAANRQFGFFKDAAAKGVVNPDNAFLIAQGKGLIADDGSLDWDAFVKAAPEQFGTTNPANPSRGVTLTMDDIKRMGPEEYNLKRDAVNAVLAQQRA